MIRLLLWYGSLFLPEIFLEVLQPLIRFLGGGGGGGGGGATFKKKIDGC